MFEIIHISKLLLFFSFFDCGICPNFMIIGKLTFSPFLGVDFV
jgi:hypothetical protein